MYRLESNIDTASTRDKFSTSYGEIIEVTPDVTYTCTSVILIQTYNSCSLLLVSYHEEQWEFS